MGPANSLFIHHITSLPSATTYTYTRSNRFGAVETRHTTISRHGVKSAISFCDGHGYVDFIQYRGAVANNLKDYANGGPKDGFNEGDYSYLHKSSICKCNDRCPCSISV
jgi:prepilin-type processing-associated H-X9-DG protein